MKNALIFQSGGPTAAINASLAGVLDAGRDKYDIIYGAINGVVGLKEKNVIDLTAKLKSEDGFINRLCLTPAMYLGSCRFKLPDPAVSDTAGIFTGIFEYLEELNVKDLYVIGGNDSMDSAAKLAEYSEILKNAAGADTLPVTVIGIPKTIDNDLVNIDHTPGFGSAAKYVASSMLEMAYDTSIYPVKSVTVVEIMGRDAGWLTAASALARNSCIHAPQLIYLPEVPFSMDECIESVRKLHETTNSVMIAVSEGIRDKDGNYIAASDNTTDKFGHQQLSGAGKALEYAIGDALGVKIRSVELNIPQRCGMHLASLTDIEESAGLGRHAVEMAEKGLNGQMSSIRRISDDPYQTEYTECPSSSAANDVRSVPRDFINESGNDVTEKAVKYLRPLIQGEVNLTYNNGLPDFLSIKHLFKS